MPLRGAVSDGDDEDELFVLADFKRCLALVERAADPAGIETHLLCEQDEFFAVIAALLFEVGRFLAHHGEVVAHAGELAVFGAHPGKSIRFVGDELDVQPALFVAREDGVCQFGNHGRRKGRFLVLPDRVALLDGFHEADAFGGTHKISLVVNMQSPRRVTPLQRSGSQHS